MATQNVLDQSHRNILRVGSAVPGVGTPGNDGQLFLDSLTSDHYYQGLDGNDTISGQLGRDYIEGGAGADILVDLGVLGFDTLGYYNSDAGVTVTLDLLGGLSVAQAAMPKATKLPLVLKISLARLTAIH